MTAPTKLGGANGKLRCSECEKLRWPGCPLCPDCWGRQNEGRGTRNHQGTVIQQKLPKEVWLATQFAASMTHKGTPFHRAVVTAARYYKVEPEQVQSALAQRSGRNQKGKKKTSTQ